MQCPFSGVKKTVITTINKENQFVSIGTNDSGGKDEISDNQQIGSVVEDFENLEPDEKEYRKLKNIMSTLKKFYIDGSLAKKQQYEYATEQIELLRVDIRMAHDQLLALKPKNDAHLKQKDYKKFIEDDLKNMTKQLEKRQEQQVEYKELWEWSEQIVKIQIWLEAHLEEYCVDHLKLKIHIGNHQEQGGDGTRGSGGKGKPKELTVEEKAIYARGLDEIMTNLTESHEFFEASMDGRLLEFQYMEMEIIQSQLEVLKRYPENNKRRQYVEETLMDDMRYCQQRIASGESEVDQKRREKILKMHEDFLKLLRFFKYKWNLLKNIEYEKNPDGDKYSTVYVYQSQEQVEN